MEFLALGLILLSGWLLSEQLIARLPARNVARTQFQLMDAFLAAIVYGAIISVVVWQIGFESSDFSPRFKFFLISILALEAAGFFVVQDILGAMDPAPRGLKRGAILVGFQIAFLVGFLMFIPAWLRWRGL